MARDLDSLLGAKDEWRNPGKRAYFQHLLEGAAREEDAPADRLLEILLEIAAPFDPSVYSAVAKRAEVGWFRNAARGLLHDPDERRRLEALRWVCFGRAEPMVAPEDLELLVEFAGDPSEAVVMEAFGAFCVLSRADPPAVARAVLAWTQEEIGPLGAHLLGVTATAWATAMGDEVTARQRDALRSPELRKPFCAGLGRLLEEMPPALTAEAAELGWDRLLAPALADLARGTWASAGREEDRALLRAMGILVSCRFSPGMVTRCDKAIVDLLDARVGALPPTEIVAYCQPSYAARAKWWRYRQLFVIATGGGHEVWPQEVAKLARNLGAAAWIHTAQNVPSAPSSGPGPSSAPPAQKRWALGMGTAEIEIFTACNMRCFNCDRSSTQAPSSEGMSLEQVRHFVEESIEERWVWHRIRILGGEPSLHPQFHEIVAEVGRYREFNPECMIQIATNGHGQKVQRSLAALPPWAIVDSTDKDSAYQDFDHYNVAPVDLDEYADSDFTLGCHISEYCGLGISRYGYYVCGAGASLDRVFGLDVGIKSLAEVSPRALTRQREALCRLCGHFWCDKEDYEAFLAGTVATTTHTRVPVMSETWRKAYDAYKAAKPVLTVFGPSDPGKGSKRRLPQLEARSAPEDDGG